MFYRKNIYSWEQWLRVVLGLAGAGMGLGLVGGPAGYFIAAAGLGIGITGLVGWCPACAMVGRRLKGEQ